MPRDPDVELVKHRLRQMRARLGLSQRLAAERAGISKSVVEKYESRDNERIPNTRQIFRLAESYGVTIDYLLGRSDDMGDSESTNGTTEASATPNGEHPATNRVTDPRPVSLAPNGHAL